jgi:hypothetical protein
MPISLDIRFRSALNCCSSVSSERRRASDSRISSTRDRGIAAARGEALLYIVRLFPNETNIEHAGRLREGD